MPPQRNWNNTIAGMFSVMVAVDVIVAEVWMLFLLLGVDRADQIDRFLKADSSSIERLKKKMEDFSLSVARIPSATDLMVLGAIGFGGTALAHYFGADLASYVGGVVSRSNADAIAETGDGAVRGPLNFLAELGLASSFFWLIVISTTVGIILSFHADASFRGRWGFEDRDRIHFHSCRRDWYGHGYQRVDGVSRILLDRGYLDGVSMWD